MKNLTGFVVLLFFTGLSCQHPKSQSDTPVRDSIPFYTQKAFSNKTPYSLRIQYTDKAVHALIRKDNDSVNRSQLISMCKNFNNLNAWEQLKRTSRIVLERSLEEKDLNYTAESYRQMGLYYENVSINDSAFYYYSKAEKIFIKEKNLKMLSQILFDKSIIQYYACDFHGSNVNLIRALKIAIREKFLKLERDCNDQLNQNSIELKDYNSALRYSLKSLQIIENNPNHFQKHELSKSLKSIAFAYYKVNDFQSAVSFYKKALKILTFSQEYPNIYANLLDRYALVNLELNRYHNAKVLLTRAHELREIYNIFQGKNYNKLYFSDYYHLKKQPLKAKDCALEAYNLSKSFRNPSDMLVSLKQLIKVDSKNALKYSTEYIRISDSMQQLERETRNKFAKIAYETEEITQQKNKAIKNYNRVWIAASGIIGLLVLLLIIKIQAAKKRELELKQIQQKANEEISNLMLDQQNKIDNGRMLEKKRIAQDLHDGIMNMLASTRINLHLLVEKAPQETRKNFNRFVDGIQDIEKEIRNIAHDLNHGALANKGSFVGIAEALIEEQKNISVCRYHLEIDWQIDWEKMAGYKKIHLYRILQEALQNILKHAQAKNVEVSMRKVGDYVLMEIFDDGIGFSLKKKKKGLGLQNIMARAQASDAKALIKTKINEGTTIEITIPIS